MSKFRERFVDDVDMIDTNAENENFVLSASDSRAKSQNENFLKDQNVNVNKANAVIENSGNAVVNVTVDAESFAKNRNKAFADADAVAIEDDRKKFRY
ncbi:hypothetical protein [Alkalihalobacterium bogoriense]|uniref:hypothetical protein n=1 Tax=Alkalihalobacterium bogoriense TaxID=246272 RepID=UPI00047E65C1|nr:hypothetical protein [Alkalihalobacterium bogoriense]